MRPAHGCSSSLGELVTRDAYPNLIFGFLVAIREKKPAPAVLDLPEMGSRRTRCAKSVPECDVFRPIGVSVERRAHPPS